jgi:hypothetical protein
MNDFIITDFLTGKESSFAHVALRGPDTDERSPTNICCVIDVTGSSGKMTSFGLDIVKHAVKTVVSMLGPNDQFSLVSFSDKSFVKFAWTHMDDDSKQSVLQRVDDLCTVGCTNLWDCLSEALALCKDVSLSHVIVLTDGKSNASLSLNGAPPCHRPSSINTFGLGCSLDSKALSRIAEQCNGQFVHIPDTSLVGTTLVHFVSHLLSATAVDVEVQFNGKVFSVGTLTSGQSRDLVFPFKDPCCPPLHLNSIVSYTPVGKPCREHVPCFSNFIPMCDRSWLFAFYHYLRTVFSSGPALDPQMVQRLAAYIESHMDIVKRLVDDDKAHKQVYDAILALRTDLAIPVSRAVSERHFESWGRHYLISIAHAHRMQMCNGPGDWGVQFYGGRLFKRLRTEGDLIYETLPLTFLSTRDDSCFAGDGLVLMEDASTRYFVRDLKRGDSVWTPAGPAKVLAVVVSQTSGPLHYITPTVGLTPYHPYRLANEKDWKFPIDNALPRALVVRHIVYNFVLDIGHVIDVGGVLCPTLGHGLDDDEVISHPFFGSMERVMSCLTQHPGWFSHGVIAIASVSRDPNSGLVNFLS